MNGPSDLTLFLGRLHPLLVHLPIGLMVVLAALELLARSRRFHNANANTGVILALAVPASLVTVLCGWLLSLGGGYDEGLLQWHKWTGIATAAVCLVAGLLYSLDLKGPYRWSLASSVLVLVVASHYGGSLTHGSDYLVRYAPGPLRAWFAPRAPTPKLAAPATLQDPTQTPAFAALVQPILADKCISCHGPEKSKGGLRLDAFEKLTKGGKSGPVLVVGKAEQSEMIKRAKLPTAEEDHMPPEGKPQLTGDELALLEWWIDAGASADKRTAELKPTPKVARILAARAGSAAPEPKSGSAEESTVPPKPLPDVQPVANELAEALSIPISPLAQNEPWLQCNASIAGTNFGDAELKRVAALGPNLKWLDLAGTRVTDAGLGSLAAMPNLVRLHLERTGITDGGLGCLAALPRLEYLNLYGTSVTDAGLEGLQKLPKLKQLYLWQTKVTPAGSKAFAEARTDPDQLQRWQDEIEKIKARINDSRITVDLGVTVPAPATTNAATASTAAAVNAQCPVSGKPIDSTKTLVHEGVLVAFCCDDCRAKFQQDPKPYLSKLEPFLTKEAKPKTNQ